MEEYITLLLRSQNDGARRALARIGTFLRMVHHRAPKEKAVSRSPFDCNEATIKDTALRLTREVSFIADSITSFLDNADVIESIEKRFSIHKKVHPDSQSEKNLNKKVHFSSPNLERRSVDMLRTLLKRSVTLKEILLDSIQSNQSGS